MCIFSLRTWSELNNRVVTELIYVHSKLMIVDDRACIIGSANINDRSLLGNRDSELAVYIEDTQFTDGMMNKQQVQVGKFSSSLRKNLFMEFLGELDDHHDHSLAGSLNLSSNHQSPPVPPRRKHLQNQKRQQNSSIDAKTTDVTDPCSDDFYKQVLLKYSAQNTKIYDMVFKVIPSDYINTFSQLKEYQKASVNRLSNTNEIEARKELSKIKGFIVLYPFRFLCNEDLTPPIGSKEILLPTALFT
jgi:phospholipase D1/2